jgi:hypothetical protein
MPNTIFHDRVFALPYVRETGSFEDKVGESEKYKNYYLNDK